MIDRDLRPVLQSLAGRYPVVTLTGPRQSGKTTLCRQAFPDSPYISLEAPDSRQFALDDPRGFLVRYSGAIIDEAQRAPALLSYLQERVDATPGAPPFILTGSQHFGLIDAVTQTLAGRTALVELLPLSLAEVRRFPGAGRHLLPTIWTGGYPRIYDKGLPAAEWLANYAATYVERDVRQILEVADLGAFQTFVRLCAGRAGQLLNLSALGADAGVTHATAKRWVSVLEASYIVFRLPALHANVRKRLIKAPKLYFYDTGLLCHLLGIQAVEQLEVHPLRGPIFECWTISEVLKRSLHAGRRPRLWFYRQRTGREVDLVIDRGADQIAVEIKAGQTVPSDAFDALHHFDRDVPASKPRRRVLVYAGETTEDRTAGRIVSWSDIGADDWLGQ